MATILRGTTPTFTFTLPFEADTLETYWVSFKQSKAELNKTKGDSGVKESGTTVTVTLSQEETLNLVAGKCMIQIRGRDVTEKAIASNIMSIEVADVLRSGVI